MTTLGRGVQGVLPCQINLTEIFSVFWKKGNAFSSAEEIITLVIFMNAGDRNGPGYDAGTFNISNNYSLVIHDVQIANEGRYFCAVTTLDDSIIYEPSVLSVYGM